LKIHHESSIERKIKRGKDELMIDNDGRIEGDAVNQIPDEEEDTESRLKLVLSTRIFFSRQGFDSSAIL
jgi:hypothetical protein